MLKETFPYIYNGFNNQNSIFIIMFITIIILLLLNTFSKIFSGNKICLVLFSLPGTFMHELMHFIIGVLFLASPTKFSLIPSFSDNNITLGYVSFSRLNFWNALPVAMAPILLIPLSIYMFEFSLKMTYSEVFSIKEFGIIFMYSYFIYSTISHSIPSSVDFKLASNLIGLIFYISLSVGIYYKIMYNY